MTRIADRCAELSLLLDCCRWNFASKPADRPSAGNVDWPRFIRLSRFHRLQGLAWSALANNAGTLPPLVVETLSRDARTIAANNLAMAQECSTLNDTFAGRGLQLLFLKGLTVAALAYRSPMLKMGWDIDILVDPGELEAAARILADRGLVLKLPADRGTLHRWHQRSKESVWARADGLHIELHTRLVDNSHLVPSLGIRSPSQRVEIAPGIALATLDRDGLFAYLCVHGASSAWFRLKWITDVAGMLCGRSEGEIERLYRRSQELGSYRAAGQALLIADALYGPVLSPSFRAMLKRERITRTLVQVILRSLLNPEPSEPTATAFGTALIHLTQFGLAPGPAFVASELRRQTTAIMTRLLPR